MDQTKVKKNKIINLRNQIILTNKWLIQITRQN